MIWRTYGCGGHEKPSPRLERSNTTQKESGGHKKCTECTKRNSCPLPNTLFSMRHSFTIEAAIRLSSSTGEHGGYQPHMAIQRVPPIAVVEEGRACAALHQQLGNDKSTWSWKAVNPYFLRPLMFAPIASISLLDKAQVFLPPRCEATTSTYVNRWVRPYPITTGSRSLVVELVVAIDQARVRFPAAALFLPHTLAGGAIFF